MQCLQAAGERESEQECHLDGQADAAEGGARHGVIGSFLMGAEFDTISKTLGHCPAVSDHVRDLPLCQPQAQGGHQQKGDEKGESQDVDHGTVTQ